MDKLKKVIKLANFEVAKEEKVQRVVTTTEAKEKISTPKAQFRAAKDKALGKTRGKDRPTVVFAAGSQHKKNLAYYEKDIYDQLKKRKQAQILHGMRDATPSQLTESDLLDIEETYLENEREDRANSLWDVLIEKAWKPRVPRFTVYEDANILFEIADLDEITEEPIDKTDLFEPPRKGKASKEQDERQTVERLKNIGKIFLRETEVQDLFELPCLLVAKGTKEAKKVEEFNKLYEIITSTTGRRRSSNAEIQTENLLVKSRSVNTKKVDKIEKEALATSYEIYDTYQELEKNTKEQGSGDNKIAKTTSSVVEYSDEALGTNENFIIASMILGRILAENVLRSKQKRMFNLPPPNPLDPESKIAYQMTTLWKYSSFETMGKDVVGMSWCPGNENMLAIAYGAYHYREARRRISGAVLLWNTKNPVNPERRYLYSLPVTAVEFSQTIPQYLAVALYDGSVEVLDITPTVGKTVIAKSERISSPIYEPIWQIQWIQSKGEEMILAASQNGQVIKYKMGSGPNLVGFLQVNLDRVEGTVEALAIEHKKTFIEGDHHPQALCLEIHPINPGMFFVGTDEGCIHICSTNFPQQHIGVLQVHNGGIYSLEFSPFSPKIFLTSGSDWFVRVWIEGIFEPILELSGGLGAIHNAGWSPTNPTIIAACTQESVRVWDLLRKNLKPVIIKTFNNNVLTVFKFSPSGRSLIVGDNEGNTHVVALDDFPFPPRFKFAQLEKVIDQLLAPKPTLKQQVKDLGYLGYPEKKI